MDDLDTLRSKFDIQERGILTAVWHHFLATGKWIPARRLHQVMPGGKKAVRPILERFGGSVVFEQDENGRLQYGLTFLGVLLSSDGESIEGVLRDYLRLAHTLALQDADRDHVTSEEALVHLRTTPDKVVELGRVLFLSSLLSGGSYGETEWSAGLPKDVEDLPIDPRSLIHEAALAQYDPNLPLPANERAAYYRAAKTAPPEDIFAFVGNERLRRTATQDWAEANLCFKAEAFKYCVVACGAVLEAILLDILLHDPDGARNALKKRSPDRNPRKSLHQWNLIDLVDAATETGFVDEAFSHLGHALRLHRDLVHPGRQIKKPIEVSEEESVLSLTTVEKIIRDLSANHRQENA